MAVPPCRHVASGVEGPLPISQALPSSPTFCLHPSPNSWLSCLRREEVGERLAWRSAPPRRAASYWDSSALQPTLETCFRGERKSPFLPYTRNRSWGLNLRVYICFLPQELLGELIGSVAPRQPGVRSAPSLDPAPRAAICSAVGLRDSPSEPLPLRHLPAPRPLRPFPSPRPGLRIFPGRCQGDQPILGK